MRRLYVLLGKSSSGKDSIYKKLLERPELDLKRIVIYTTRPMRSGECEGREYHFTDEQERDRLQREGKIIERRDYNTVYGIWSYFTVADEQFDTQGDCLVIGTLKAYEDFKSYFGEDKVVPLYIRVDDGERLMRALKREMQQEKPGYSELCRRFLADEEDFSSDKLKAAGIEGGYENADISICLEQILRDWYN